MKQQKVYIAIALYKDAEPQIIGVYSTKEKTEANAYAFSTTNSWVNIIEKVVQ